VVSIFHFSLKILRGYGFTNMNFWKVLNFPKVVCPNAV
jgi:hypothetical protein